MSTRHIEDGALNVVAMSKTAGVAEGDGAHAVRQFDEHAVRQWVVMWHKAGPAERAHLRRVAEMWPDSL